MGNWPGADEGRFVLQPDLSLGDDVVHDHIDHGASSKGQGIGQEGLSQHHGKGTKDPGQRLHHAAQLPVPKERPETCATMGRVRQTHRQRAQTADSAPEHRRLIPHRSCAWQCKRISLRLQPPPSSPTFSDTAGAPSLVSCRVLSLLHCLFAITA